MANNSNSNNNGIFIPTTEIWDSIGRIEQADVSSPEFKELIIRMYQNINRMALALNVSTKGYYDTAGEFVTGNKWFPQPGLSSATKKAPNYRDEQRTVLNLPQNGSGFALPAMMTTPIKHNIFVTTKTLFVDIYGVANDRVGYNYYQLGWASSAGATNIQITVNQTEVVIINNTAINFTDVVVVLAYLN